MNRATVTLPLLVLVCLLPATAQMPIPPKADWPGIGVLEGRDEQDLHSAWQPMGGSKQALVLNPHGPRAVLLPVNFDGTDIERASWDVAVDLDLTTCNGLQFHFYVQDAGPVSYFSLYCQSGDGWYAMRVAPQHEGQWQHITIPKESAHIEGTPAGWGKIRTIRFSAWRGQNKNTQCALANIGLLGADAPIVIVRGDSAAASRPAEAKSVQQFAETVATALKQQELPYLLMSDVDVTPERLRGKKVAILPHNPGMPEQLVADLTGFVEDGGKLIAFYSLPSELIRAIGMEPGDWIRPGPDKPLHAMHAVPGILTGLPDRIPQRSWNITTVKPVPGKSDVAAVWHTADGSGTGHPAIVASDSGIHVSHVLLDDGWPAKRTMILAMIGRFLPELWQRSAESAIARIGVFGPYTGYADAARHITKLTGRAPGPGRDLAAARTARNSAGALLRRRAFGEAIAAAQQSHQALLRAWCQAQKPLRNEQRLFWCHSAFGVDGMDWDEAIKTLADNGFTAILPNMLWGGVAYYDSDVLPTHDSVAERGDQIELCLAACRKYGVECHVWKVNWNMSGRAPKSFVARMKAAGRTQVSFDGKADEPWLCPSHPENQQLEIDAMVEVARKYDVHGIHFDYIRYPGRSYCFCPGCRERFEKALGRKVRDWPADAGRSGALEREWLDFRQANITKVVAAVALQARRVRPAVKISGAVFRNYVTDRDNVGQDWKLWCDKGYLSFVCPMDYTPDNAQFGRWVEQQGKLAGLVPCYPGIGLSCWPNTSDVVKLIEQINITRKHGTGGFTVFNYTPSAAGLLPLCGAGATRPQ